MLAGFLELFLLQLLAGQNGFGGIDDDHELAAVRMGSELGSVLAAQDRRGFDGGLAKRLAGGVNDIPFAFNGILVGHISGHFSIPPFLMAPKGALLTLPIIAHRITLVNAF